MDTECEGRRNTNRERDKTYREGQGHRPKERERTYLFSGRRYKIPQTLARRGS